MTNFNLQFFKKEIHHENKTPPAVTFRMSWQIDYYSEAVEENILNLPDGLLARYLKLSDLMLELGANLGMPHTKALHDGLFELRIKAKEGIARTFYCTQVGKRIIVLHVFVKKTQKIPTKELKIAIERLKEVSKNDTSRTKS